MNLSTAARQYLIFLQATRLPASKLARYRRVIQNVLEFYGPLHPLDELDESTVLDYASVNDPFDCDPLHEERGEVYCQFVEWLMQNELIPAWAGQAGSLDAYPTVNQPEPVKHSWAN